jgi:hypothetical protein
MFAVPTELVHAAERVATDAIRSIASEVRAELHERLEDAPWWWAFHGAMLSTLPRWRWAARLHHRRMRRRYAAAIKADRALAACPALARLMGGA